MPVGTNLSIVTVDALGVEHPFPVGGLNFGVIRRGEISAEQKIRIYNNKNGSAAVGAATNCYLTITDTSGGNSSPFITPDPMMQGECTTLTSGVTNNPWTYGGGALTFNLDYGGDSTYIADSMLVSCEVENYDDDNAVSTSTAWQIALLTGGESADQPVTYLQPFVTIDGTEYSTAGWSVFGYYSSSPGAICLIMLDPTENEGLPVPTPATDFKIRFRYQVDVDPANFTVDSSGAQATLTIDTPPSGLASGCTVWGSWNWATPDLTFQTFGGTINVIPIGGATTTVPTTEGVMSTVVPEIPDWYDFATTGYAELILRLNVPETAEASPNTPFKIKVVNDSY